MILDILNLSIVLRYASFTPDDEIIVIGVGFQHLTFSVSALMISCSFLEMSNIEARPLFLPLFLPLFTNCIKILF